MKQPEYKWAIGSPMKQLEYNWAIDNPMKQLHYRWGYTVGVLLLIAVLPASGVTDDFFDSLVLTTSLAILVIISGIAVFWRKALGWYLYFGWLALFILACAYGALSHLVFHVVPGGFSFSSSMFIMWLSCMALASLFLYLQIRYWRRRALLCNRNKIAYEIYLHIMSGGEKKLSDPEVTDGKRKFAYWKFGLCVLGGFILGFILGGPLGALVLSLLGYFLPLRYFTGKWRPGRVGTNVLGFLIVIPVALLLIRFLFGRMGIW